MAIEAKPGPRLADVEARLHQLMPKIEDDRAKLIRSKERRATREARNMQAAKSNGEEYDPANFDALPAIHQIDEAMHREFHALHYQIADLQKAQPTIVPAKALS